VVDGDKKERKRLHLGMAMGDVRAGGIHVCLKYGFCFTVHHHTAKCFYSCWAAHNLQPPLPISLCPLYVHSYSMVGSALQEQLPTFGKFMFCDDVDRVIEIPIRGHNLLCVNLKAASLCAGQISSDVQLVGLEEKEEV
jgi:hypothetical protein